MTAPAAAFPRALDRSPPRRPGRGAPHPDRSARLRPVSTSRATSKPRGLAARAAGAPPPRLRQLDLVYGANTKVPFASRTASITRLALRRDQAGRRADEPTPIATSTAPGNRPALLHGLRALGPARHVAYHLRRRDPRRPADHPVRRRHMRAATSPTSTTSSPACRRPRPTSRSPHPASSALPASTTSATTPR